MEQGLAIRPEAVFGDTDSIGATGEAEKDMRYRWPEGHSSEAAVQKVQHAKLDYVSGSFLASFKLVGAEAHQSRERPTYAFRFVVLLQYADNLASSRSLTEARRRYSQFP